MDNTTRQQKYQSLPTEIQDLYASGEMGSINQEIAKKFGLAENAYPEFIHVFGDIILGLENKENLEQLLQMRLQLEPQTTSVIAQEIRTRLFPFLKSAESTSSNQNAETNLNLIPEQNTISTARQEENDAVLRATQATQTPTSIIDSGDARTVSKEEILAGFSAKSVAPPVANVNESGIPSVSGGPPKPTQTWTHKEEPPQEPSAPLEEEERITPPETPLYRRPVLDTPNYDDGLPRERLDRG